VYLLIRIYFIQLEVLENTFIKFLCLERSERHDTFDEQIFNALVEKIEILNQRIFVSKCSLNNTPYVEYYVYRKRAVLWLRNICALWIIQGYWVIWLIGSFDHEIG